MPSQNSSHIFGKPENEDLSFPKDFRSFSKKKRFRASRKLSQSLKRKEWNYVKLQEPSTVLSISWTNLWPFWNQRFRFKAEKLPTSQASGSDMMQARFREMVKIRSGYPPWNEQRVLQLKLNGWNTIVSVWDGLFSGAMLVSGSVFANLTQWSRF